MIKLLKTIKSSFITLGRNKLRTTLTMLGIIIGIASVIIIMSVGAGAQSLIINEIKGVGSNLIGVLPGGSGEDEPPASVMGITITTLKYEDAIAMLENDNITDAQAVCAYVSGVDTISWQENSVGANYQGVTSEYPSVENASVESGRFFSETEERSMAKVVVIGSQLKKDLFGDSNALGENIKIKRESFQIIGIMKERGSVGFQNQDGYAFIPLRTAQKILLGIDHVNFVRLKVGNEENMKRAAEDIRLLLRQRHNIDDPADDDFTVRGMDQALDTLSTVTNALKMFLAAVAAISLLVGGIGIMNIMLISVNERIREVGLRKALGATNKSILTQFLSESVTMTSVGGIIGMLIGFSVSGLIAAIAQYLEYDWDFVVTPFSIILAVSVSVIVGIVFGIFPARKASKLEAIKALRYE